MPFRVVLVALACLAPACSLPRGTLGGDGGGGGLDTGTETGDTGPRPDAYRPDTGIPEDAWMADDASMPEDAATLPDAWAEPIDASMAPDVYVPPRPTCTEAYGAAADYERCSAEDAEECVFYVALSGSSCGVVCGDGRCVNGFDNGPTSNRCDHGTTLDTCESTHTNEVCVCRRP
jgi:hypothetical protein